MRILPYVDDFLVSCRDVGSAYLMRHRVSILLDRLGLVRHPDKGQWTPTQVIDHLGLRVDSVRGLFMVTPKRVERIKQMAKALITMASSRARVVPTRQIASFCGLAQSCYLAIPPARFFLRALHDCVGKSAVDFDGLPILFKQKWNASVRLSRQALQDLQWWRMFDEKYNGRAI